MQQAAFVYEPLSRPAGSASPVSRAVPAGPATAGRGRPPAQPPPMPLGSSGSYAERSAGCAASTSPFSRQARAQKTGLQQLGAGAGILGGAEVPGAEPSQPGSASGAEATWVASAPGPASGDLGSASCAPTQPSAVSAAHDARVAVPDSPLPEEPPNLATVLPPGANTAPPESPELQLPPEAMPAGIVQHPASKDLPHQEDCRGSATQDLPSGGWGQGGLADDDLLDSLNAADLWPPHPPSPAHAAAASQGRHGAAAQHAQQGLLDPGEGLPALGSSLVASAEQYQQQQQQPGAQAGLMARSDANEKDHAADSVFVQTADAGPDCTGQIRQGGSAAGQVAAELAEGVAKASRPGAADLAEGASGRGSTVVGDTGLGLPAVPNPKCSISEQRVIIHADVDCFYCQVGAQVDSTGWKRIFSLCSHFCGP